MLGGELFGGHFLLRGLLVVHLGGAGGGSDECDAAGGHDQTMQASSTLGLALHAV
jgi:hypothetical protein